MQQPPVLPEAKLARVQRVGQLHGVCVLYVAGVFALLSAMGGDFLGAITGLLIAGAGAVEHHGAALLKQGEPRGISWLVGSQLFLFLSIAAYCAIQLFRFELPPIPEQLRPMLETNAAQAGMSVDVFLRLSYRTFFSLLLAGSILYQGGLGLYYFTQRNAVARALGEE